MVQRVYAKGNHVLCFMYLMCVRKNGKIEILYLDDAFFQSDQFTFASKKGNRIKKDWNLCKSQIPLC